ncbi:hypothetical protein Pelo_4201 [Pelomyxa schiedti]|nr:hypothetical protein Pelo_4201 [Pelomyxa schiedti]
MLILRGGILQPPTSTGGWVKKENPHYDRPQVTVVGVGRAIRMFVSFNITHSHNLLAKGVDADGGCIWHSDKELHLRESHVILVVYNADEPLDTQLSTLQQWTTKIKRVSKKHCHIVGVANSRSASPASVAPLMDMPEVIRFNYYVNTDTGAGIEDVLEGIGLLLGSPLPED